MAAGTGVRPSDALWKEGAGYYIESLAQVLESPMLPDVRRLGDQRILEIFDRHGNLAPGCRVLELGCGRSRWLPFLALQRQCEVSGLDNEPFAADLARANLMGAGASGRIVCGDAFDLSGRPDMRGAFDLVYSMGLLEHFDDVVDRIAALKGYLRPGGRLLTTVPNMQGFNWLMQRLGSRDILEMHVVYDRKRLARAHEAAGLSTIACGYAGFFDGYVTATGGSPESSRFRLHKSLSRASNLLAEAWLVAGGGAMTPELSWCSPHVYYVGTPAAP